ncbi:21360_t:CDS:2, partial [Racocetra persica]
MLKKCFQYRLNLKARAEQELDQILTKNEQEKLLTELKERRPQLHLIFSQVLQNVANRLKGDKLILSCGREKEELFLNVRLHRELEGKIKILSLVRKNGKYYACFANEVEKKLSPKTNKKVGIDLGLIDFCVLDNGKKYPNPRIYKKGIKKLIEAQKRVDRKEKGMEETGGQLVKVNSAYTSQTCSFCDEPAKEKVELSQRVYECWNCGKKLDRDVNSARNILKLAEPRFDGVIHVPVMLKEVLDHLNLKKGGIYVDGTFDKEFSNLTQKDKIFFAPRFCLINDNFANFEEHLKKMGVQEVDGFLFDLGLSSDQLTATERGFSYRSDSPLDMRISQTTKLSATDIINNYPEAKLADIFYHYGEEKKA